MNSLEIELADLQSSFRSLMDSHKRLRSRIGMQELRERRGQSATNGADRGAPPPGATKQQLRDYYLRGKNPRQIALEAMEDDQ